MQTVVSMACNLPLDVVEGEAGTCGRMTVTEALALLSRMGVSCRPIAARLVADFWPQFYRQAGGRRLLGLGFQLPKEGEEIGHAVILVGPTLYDPLTGKASGLGADTLRLLDWLALLPEDVAELPALTRLRAASTMS